MGRRCDIDIGIRVFDYGRNRRDLGRLPLWPIVVIEDRLPTEYKIRLMALIGANELKKKMLIEIDGQPYNVLDVFFATPTARGASTMVRTRLKNLLNGSVQEKSFRTSEKFPEPDVEIAAVSFLYNDGEGFHFMDQSTYEQFMLPADTVGDDRFYLKEGLNLEIFKYNGNAVSLQLP